MKRGSGGGKSLIDKPPSFLSFATALGLLLPHGNAQSGPFEAVKDMASVTTDYISVGGNRHPGAADWDVSSGVLAFGADNNVALWEPLVSFSR